MSSPVPCVLSDVHCQKRKCAHRVAAAPASVRASDVQAPVPATGPPYTQAVYIDNTDVVRPAKKVRACRPDRVVSSERDDGVPHIELPIPGQPTFHHLPPVSISHPSGVGKHTLHRRVSYGDLGLDEVSGMCAPSADTVASAAEPADIASADESDGGSSDMSDNGSSRSVRGNAFVDDVASEGFTGSESASEEEYNSISEDDTPVADLTSAAPSEPVPASRVSMPSAAPSAVIASTVQSSVRVSQRSKNKTERGRYVDTMIQNGLSDQVMSSDHDPGDPSVVISPRKQSKARPVAATRVVDGLSTVPVSMTSAAPSVYLEDLDGPPLPVSPRKSCRSKVVGKPAPLAHSLSVHTDLLAIDPAAVPSSHPAKSLVLSGVHTKAPLASVTPVVGTSDLDGKRPGIGGSAAVTVLASAVDIVPGGSSGSCGPQSDGHLVTLDAMLGAYNDAACDDDDGDIGTEAVAVPALTGSVATGNPDDVPEPEDESQRIMLIELQEEQHVVYYSTLPGLGKHCPMVPLGQTDNSFNQPPFIMLDAISEFFHIDALRSVVAARLFYGYGQFCNLSTMPLSAFKQDGCKLICAGRTAVSMIVGVVVDSSLIKIGHLSGHNGSTAEQGGKMIHGIRLLPFIQPWRRETSAIGAIFDLDLLHSENMCSDGIDFATRCNSLLNPDSNTNRHPTPALVHPVNAKKGSGGKAASPGKPLWPRSPTKPGGLSARAPRDYYHCLGFDDKIPVFDGRASKGRHFLFRPEDFDQLATMPQVPATRELDRFTLVAVGYTPTVWSPGLSNPHVSMNMQFIIVLGQAPKSDALAAAGYGPE